jgi:tetratricopeptide (TPR) repeat protein
VAGTAAGAGGAAALALRERAVALALVSAHVEQGEYRPARHLLAEAAAQGPVSLALALVRLHLTFGATEAAEEALAQSAARGAPEGAVELHRGLVALAKGQHAAAAERFAAVLDKARAPPAAPPLAHTRRAGRPGGAVPRWGRRAVTHTLAAAAGPRAHDSGDEPLVVPAVYQAALAGRGDA